MFLTKDILTVMEKNKERLKELGVKRLAVFGSFARGAAVKKSDIDVLVEFNRGKKTFDNYMGLRDLLHRLLHRKIDLVTEKALKPQMRAAVLNEAHYARL